MALGDYNNGDNNKKKYYEPIVYSPFGTSNTDGVDPSAISYQFYNGMLKISISPMKAGARPDDIQKWDHENAVTIWLTHAKARILADEIRNVLAHPDEVNNGGVYTGKGDSQGFISFSNGKELGASGPCLIVRRLNETGITSSYAYQFKDRSYAAVRNFDQNNITEYDHINYPNLEIDELLTLLDDYSSSIGGAMAYSVMNAQKYDTNRSNTKMNLIMEKLGIDTSAEYSGGTRNSGKSFFSSNQGRDAGNNIPSGGMRSTTLDELGSEMD